MIIIRYIRISKLFLLLVSFVGLLVSSALASPERPLIFVPGIVGSVLSTEAGEIVWGDAGSLNSRNFKRLDLLPEQNQAALQPTDVIRDVPLVFGTLKIGVYSKLVDFFTGERGIRDRISGNNMFGEYKEDVDFFVFPYDWRLTNFANAKRLNDFVNEKVPEGEYDLIVHSMGGVIARVMLGNETPTNICMGDELFVEGLPALSQKEKNQLCNAVYGEPDGTVWPYSKYNGELTAAKRINTLIELAVPHRGSVNVLVNFLEGWGALSRTLAGGMHAIQNTIVSMPSTVELSPHYKNCCAIGRPGRAGNQTIDTLEARLSFDFWSKKVLGFGLPTCPYTNCRLKAHALRIGLDNRAKIAAIMDDQLPNTVDHFYSVVGRYVEDTKNTYYIDQQEATGNGAGFRFRNSDEGDGTVHQISALPPEYPSVQPIFANKTSHQFIIEDDGIQQQIHGLFLDPVVPPLEVGDGEAKVFEKELLSVGISLSEHIVSARETLKFKAKMRVNLNGVPLSQDTVSSSKQIRIVMQRADSDEQGLPLTNLEYSSSNSDINLGVLSFTATSEAPKNPGIYLVNLLSQDSETPMFQTYLHVIDIE